MPPPPGDPWFLGYGPADSTTWYSWSSAPSCACTSTVDVQNLSASKTEKVKSTLPKKSSTLSVSRGFVHAKSRTRIGCWNVRKITFGTTRGKERRGEGKNGSEPDQHRQPPDL